MIAASAELALDERPVIVVESLRVESRFVRLAGTASVFEGNLIIQLLYATGESDVVHVTATRGAPDRGAWAFDVDHARVDTVVLSSEAMEGRQAPQVQVSLKGNAS